MVAIDLFYDPQGKLPAGKHERVLVFRFGEDLRFHSWDRGAGEPKGEPVAIRADWREGPYFIQDPQPIANPPRDKDLDLESGPIIQRELYDRRGLLVGCSLTGR